MRARLGVALAAVVLAVAGCSDGTDQRGDPGVTGTAGAADIGGEVRGEVRTVLGPDDDGGAALQVARGDGTIVEVIVASEDALACADGSPVSYTDVDGRTITATAVPGTADVDDSGGQAVRSDEVVVDC